MMEKIKEIEKMKPPILVMGLAVALVVLVFAVFALAQHYKSVEYQRCKTLSYEDAIYHPAPNRGHESSQGQCLFDLATLFSDVNLCDEIQITPVSKECQTRKHA